MHRKPLRLTRHITTQGQPSPLRTSHTEPDSTCIPPSGKAQPDKEHDIELRVNGLPVIPEEDDFDSESAGQVIAAPWLWPLVTLSTLLPSPSYSRRAYGSTEQRVMRILAMLALGYVVLMATVASLVLAGSMSIPALMQAGGLPERDGMPDETWMEDSVSEFDHRLPEGKTGLVLVDVNPGEPDWLYIHAMELS